MVGLFLQYSTCNWRISCSNINELSIQCCIYVVGLARSLSLSSRDTVLFCFFHYSVFLLYNCGDSRLRAIKTVGNFSLRHFFLLNKLNDLYFLPERQISTLTFSSHFLLLAMLVQLQLRMCNMTISGREREVANFSNNNKWDT